MTAHTLTNKIIVVTGGGNSIGTAICETCAASGARLVITYNSGAAHASRLAATTLLSFSTGDSFHVDGRSLVC